MRQAACGKDGTCRRRGRQVLVEREEAGKHSMLPDNEGGTTAGSTRHEPAPMKRCQVITSHDKDGNASLQLARDNAGQIP